MVPVLRNCQDMSLADIERAIMEYANKGRSGKISLEDLSGGTFTISNGGVFRKFAFDTHYQSASECDIRYA